MIPTLNRGVVHTPEQGESELRKMLRTAHERAATPLGEIVGDAVFGWRDRSIGTEISTDAGRLWLRTVWSPAHLARGLWWTGSHDASDLAGISKPSVRHTREQREGDLVFRTETMTVVVGSPCATTPDLRRSADRAALDDTWWNALGSSLAALAAVSTSRTAVDPFSVRHRIRVFFGVHVDTDPSTWRAAHGDLHWGNLHAGPLALVDWEAWGLAPRGYDAAFLLCHSLGVPDVAEEIERRFALDLRSSDGVIAQLYVLTKMLTRADAGEYADLIDPIHRHADRLLGRSAPSRPFTLGDLS